MTIFDKDERRIIAIAKDQMDTADFGNSIRSLREVVQTLVQILDRVARRESLEIERFRFEEKGPQD